MDYSKCGERGVSLLGGNFLGGGGDTPMHTMAQEDWTQWLGGHSGWVGSMLLYIGGGCA